VEWGFAVETRAGGAGHTVGAGCVAHYSPALRSTMSETVYIRG
jgi:hypothetical protein